MSGAQVLLDASGEALRLGCAAAPFLVKPNVDEAGEMLGRAVESIGDALVAAEVFMDAGVELVALSMGADGLLMASQAEVVWAKPPRVQVCNPVGAGDALLAGVALALVRGLGLGEMARWAVAAGTAAALRAGVAVGTRDEVVALWDQVSVERCDGKGRG
jgi:fructose-1-phosphate kinase PfkB-like protein